MKSLLGFVSKLAIDLHTKTISNYPEPLSFFEIIIAYAKFAKLIMSCVPKSTLNYLKEPSFLKIIIQMPRLNNNLPGPIDRVYKEKNSKNRLVGGL